MQEKLQKIKARCEELLVTSSLIPRWRKEYIHGNGLDCEVWIHPDGKQCWPCEIAPIPLDYNKINLSEAGWMATIAVINSMGDYNSDIEMRGYYSPIVNAILLAWPDEILK